MRSSRQNPGWSSLRQRLAPQPDRGLGQGVRPQDHLRRAGGRVGGALGTYDQMLDNMNPNQDKPLPGGLNDAQVRWMKKNLLGRQGPVTGREGARFQNQISQRINNAGGQQAFGQMLGAMPGYGRQAGGPGAAMPNRFRPGQQQAPGARPGMPQPQTPPVQRPDQPVWGGGAQRPQPAWPPSEPRKMFPQQAEMYARQDGATGPGAGAPSAPSPQVGSPMGNRMAQQAQGQSQGQAQGRQSGSQARQTPQQRGQDLATNPASRAVARAYGGETDPERQKAHDRQRFGKRGIPLTPEVEEGMRQLTDQYIQTMIEIGYSEADAAAQVDLAKERLANDFSNDQQSANDQMADAGLFNSGIRQSAQDDITQDYGRGFQDLGLAAAQQQRAFADARAQALEAMRQGRQELAMMGTRQAVESAASGNNYSGLSTGRRGKKGSRRRGNR